MKDGKRKRNSIGFLANRIKYVRTEVFALSQEEMSQSVNKYLQERYKSIDHKAKFSQNTMTKLESDSAITCTKLTHLLNFFYEEKRINPSWIMIEENMAISMYVTKLKIDNDLGELHELTKKSAMDILKYVNDVKIIIDNFTTPRITDFEEKS